MLEFIKKVIENPEKFDEDTKYKMFLEFVNKDVSASELAEIIKFIKKYQTIKLNIENAIDMAWTWWSGLDRINTTTISSLLLAKQWVKIAKHWNNASSGRFGSFDLLEKLWYKIPKTKEEIFEELDKNNVAFLYAKLFYPFFKHFAQIRKKYGKPTIFNILWPLLNPANTNYQIIWCSFENKMELMIETCKILWRKNVLIVRWEDGLDEITLSWKTKVYELKNGTIKTYYIKPEDFGFKTCKLDEILEKDINKKIEIAKKIINWENIWKYSDLVNLNVKVALKFLGK